jgi:hypothetical protein
MEALQEWILKTRPGDVITRDGVGWRVMAEHQRRVCVAERWMAAWAMASRAESDTPMRSKSQAAWETAAKCATLAEETDDPNEREYYARLRDAWTTLAKRCEFSSVSDVTDSAKF